MVIGLSALSVATVMLLAVTLLNVTFSAVAKVILLPFCLAIRLLPAFNAIVSPAFTLFGALPSWSANATSSRPIVMLCEMLFTKFTVSAADKKRLSALLVGAAATPLVLMVTLSASVVSVVSVGVVFTPALFTSYLITVVFVPSLATDAVVPFPLANTTLSPGLTKPFLLAGVVVSP